MAKDDYHVIAFYILSYLYSCVKRGVYPDVDVVYLKDYPAKVPVSYIEYILRQLWQKEYIAGMVVVDVSDKDGKAYQLESVEDIEITDDGIEYLQQNDTMKKTKKYFLEAGGLLLQAIQAMK